MFNKINKLSVKVSSSCNMNCSFCHQMFDDKYKNNLQFKDYNNLYNFLITLPFEERVDVTLTGGEITLAEENFYNVLNVFKKIERNIDVTFDICIITNGTNMDLIYKWCDKKIIIPHKTAISWDGIYSSSKSRHISGKYNDEYFKNVIKELGSSKYNSDIAIVMAITPMTIDSLAESFKFCLDNNALNWGYYFIHEGNYSSLDLQQKFREQLIKISNIYLENIKYKDIYYYNWQMIYTKRKFPDKFYLCGKLGKNYHIDCDGKIYPCIYFGDHKSFSFGDIQNGLNKDIVNQFIKEYLIAPTCPFEKCNNIQCSECPASNLIHNKSLSKRFENTCDMLKIENEIYDIYASKIDTIKNNLYIPNEEYLKNKKMYDIIKTEIVIHDECELESPNFNGVQIW